MSIDKNDPSMDMRKAKISRQPAPISALARAKSSNINERIYILMPLFKKYSDVHFSCSRRWTDQPLSSIRDWFCVRIRCRGYPTVADRIPRELSVVNPPCWMIRQSLLWPLMRFPHEDCLTLKGSNDRQLLRQQGF